MEQTKYDVFISYSRHDYVDDHENVIPNNEVSKIMKTLTDAGITYWIDREGLYSGDKFTEELPKIIKSAPIFVYLSTANANKSKYTSREIAIADEYGKYIIPVRIDMTPYSDKVIFRIADVSFIKYAVNPTKGREELVRSIKAFLEKEKETELQKKEEERQRKEELERQRKQQEEEKKWQEKIALIETEIAALESQKTEREKIVLQKEQELKLAQVDLKACETKILKLQTKHVELQSSRKEAKTINVKGNNSKATYDSEWAKETRGFSGVSKTTFTESKNKANKHNQRFFSSKSDVFAYVKSNSKYPTSLSNDFDIDSSISWTAFTAKLSKEYGIVITKEGIVNIKGLVNRIWNASK